MKQITFHKKFIATACLCALCFVCLFCAFQSADAVDSPKGSTASSNGLSLTVTAHDGIKIILVPTSQVAKNCPQTPVASFYAYATDGRWDHECDFVFSSNVVSAAAGKIGNIYVEHGDGELEEWTCQFDEAGRFTKVSRLSVYSVVADLSGGSSSNKDVSTISPQTGDYDE